MFFILPFFGFSPFFRDETISFLFLFCTASGIPVSVLGGHEHCWHERLQEMTQLSVPGSDARRSCQCLGLSLASTARWVNHSKTYV